MLKEKNKIKKKSLYVIGSLLILSSISIVGFKHYKEYENKEREDIAIHEYYEITDEEVKIETTTSKENVVKEEIKENKEVNNYIAILRIPKINLKRGLVDKESKYNDIKYNIMIHDRSTSPDVIGGNVILLAHSGTSKVSYFKNLDKLKLDDIVYLDYNGKTYKYKLINIYDIEKNGKAVIKKNTKKSSITLITCRTNTNRQIVLIGELLSEIEN